MGILDWLTESLGSSGGMTGGTPAQPGPGAMMPQYSPMGDPTGGQIPLPPAAPARTMPMPPMQMTGQDGAPIPLPPGGDPMTAGGDYARSGGLPLPTGGDPMTAGGNYANPGGLPPMPPAAHRRTESRMTEPLPITPPGNGTNGVGPGLGVGAGATIGGEGPQARSFIGRALGLDPNRENTLRGSLGAGLKAAGENANKGKGAAFMGSAGAAIEGGKNADDKTIDQQGRVVDRATRAKEVDQRGRSAGITDQLNIARTKLADEQAKMAKSGGKDSVLNSQQQLYLRADALAITENSVLKSRYDNTAKQFGVDSKEAKEALDAYNKSVVASREAQYGKLGLDPKMANKISKQPGMSQENPMQTKGMTQQALDALPPGAWVMGPNGKPLQKKAPAAAPAGANQPAPAPSTTPAVQPPIPPAVANARASMEADDEED